MRCHAVVLSVFFILISAITTSTKAGLTEYWAFDTDYGNAVAGGHTATAVGSGLSISAESARGSGSLQISHNTSTGDYLHVSDPVIPTSNPTAFTVSTWYKFDGSLGTQTTDDRNFLWETFPSYTTGAGLNDTGGSRDIEWFYATVGGSISNTAGPIVNDDAWHHTAVVWDKPNNVATMYHDGQQFSSIAIGAQELYQPTAGLNIGNHRAGDGSRNWQGYIDDFAVYNGTLDAAGVNGLFIGSYTPQTVPVTGPPIDEPIPTSPLQAHWTFDSDYSSTVHNDIYQGQPQGGSYTNITNTSGQFIRGTGALQLDSGPDSGNATYVKIPNEVADVTRDRQITISAWYNYSDISSDGSDERNFIYESSPPYSLSFGLRDDGGGNRDAEWWFEGLSSDTSGPAITSDQWNHVVMVLDQDSNRAQFYHNGVIRDDIHVGAAELPQMSSFNIGNHRAGDGARDFDGFIDDVAVFHGVLDADGVAGLYSGSLTPETVPVLDEIPPPPPVEEPAPFVEGSWTMVVLPDTQLYCYEANAHIFNTMTQWIVDNKDARNIQLVMHEGDITNSDNVEQWTYAKTALSKLDGVVPYVLTAGNHDYHLTNRSTLIDDFISPSDNPLNDPAQGGILLGQYVEGRLDNSYYEMTAPDGRKLLIISMEYGPRQEVVDWADSVAAQEEFADHTAIMITHAYLYNDDTLYDWDLYGSSQVANPHAYSAVAADTHDGQELWDELIGINGNFEMTFNGHVIGAAQTDADGVGYLASEGVDGNMVQQMLFNAQHLAGNGGDGWLRLLEFLPDGKTVRVKTFSPYLDESGWPQWRVDADDWFTFELSALTRLPGDANGDGIVDDDDASILASNWLGTNKTWTEGDFNGDGIVNDDDATLLATNWQTTTPPESVPEPGVWALLIAAMVSLATLTRRRRYG